VIEAVCVVFVTVVGPQVEVCADLHLFGEQFIGSFRRSVLATRSSRSGSNFVEDGRGPCSPAGEFWLDAQSVETEVPSAQAPTRTLIDVFSSDFSVIG